MKTLIEAKKDLYNAGKCFTKGEIYEVEGWDKINQPAGLMEKTTINDLGEKHLIGSWWREFKIIN